MCIGGKSNSTCTKSLSFSLDLQEAETERSNIAQEVKQEVLINWAITLRTNGPGLRELTVREDLDHMSAFWAGSLSNQPVTPSEMATVTSPERYREGKDLPKAHSY